MDQRFQFIETSIREKLALGQTLEDAEYALRNIFGKEEVETAIKKIKESDPILAGEVAPVALSENQDYLGWYQGPRDKEDSHWNLLKEHLFNKKNPWTKEMIKSLDLASDSIVEHLVPPKSKRPLTSKGLVLGYIQSGKTANFSAVIAKTIDEGYKLIIVLSGMHNNLRLQTQTRLVEELERPKPEACMTLTRVDEKGDFDKKQAVTANRALGSKDGFALVVLKKNTHVLRAFNDWISKANKENIKNCATLIVDDESDQASINTNKPEQDPTAINSKIRDLINHFDKVSYVGYTATPFANILVDGSLDGDIYPRDFLICLEKPPTYFGPEELFGRMGVNGDDEKRPIPVIRTLPENEDNIVDGKKVIPESLKLAIRTFIISGVLRLFRGQRNDHIMMLVHISHLISEHERYHEWIQQYIQELQLAFDDYEELPEEFNRILEDDHKVTTKFILEEDIFFKSNQFFKEVRNFIDKLEIILENSASSDRLSFDRKEPLWGIVIGGNTLSRGLTIEGLTISYFDRTTKQYDTLLQMGRWFGYRKGYVDLTRIFVSESMIINFHNLATVEQEIRDEINAMAVNQERPIDVAVRIRSFPNLKITSNNKMRTAVRSSFTYSGSKIQFRTMKIDDISILNKNRKTVENLFSKLKNQAERTNRYIFNEFKNAILYHNVSSEYIIQFLENFQLNTEHIRFNKNLGIRYIADLNKHDELTNWSVCLMSSKSGKVEYTLPSGEKVYLAVRSSLDKPQEGKEYITLRSLVPTLHEAVDMADILKPESDSYSEYRKKMTKISTTDTKLRREKRPKERGLLLIYPLDPSKALPETMIKGLEALPIYAVSLVFPSSKNDRSFMSYVENVTI